MKAKAAQNIDTTTRIIIATETNKNTWTDINIQSRLFLLVLPTSQSSSIFNSTKSSWSANISSICLHPMALKTAANIKHTTNEIASVTRVIQPMAWPERNDISVNFPSRSFIYLNQTSSFKLKATKKVLHFQHFSVRSVSSFLKWSLRLYKSKFTTFFREINRWTKRSKDDLSFKTQI